MYSKQTIYCNCCGIVMYAELPKVMGKFKCCSTACCDEMQWRETLSILGKEYYPKGKPLYCASCNQALDAGEGDFCKHCEEVKGYK